MKKFCFDCVAGIIFLICLPGIAQQLELDTNCVVSILNQTARVQSDGTWHIDNVPANFGLVRVRATCVKDGITLSGESDFINLEAGITNGFAPFSLGSATPIPVSITITAPGTNLNAAGATAQLTVTALYPDNSTRNIAGATNGTSYTVSNPNTATIRPEGVVTARQSGVVVISAINEGAIGFFRMSVVFSGLDSDGDGIPDDIEIANGLDPHNPVDAQEDPDGDGLSNFEELMVYGTDPHNPDTDGDGISDGDEVHGRFGFVTNPLLKDSDGDGINDLLEIQTGSNPNDPNSYNLAAALQSFEVTPASFVLTVNTIIGQASRQLSVIGHLKDGNTIDLTSTSRRTVYSSDNLFVANFGSPDGRVFAGTNGTATITVSNSTFVARALVTVRTSTPQTLSFIPIPGFANEVDVSGNYAYVAAGASGLQVVDVSDRRNPRIVSSLATPGNADDVKVAGNLAYMAAGSAGLQVISLTNPLAPAVVGNVAISGSALDVALAGTYAYVSAGSAGMKIVDVSSPSAPRIVGTVGTLATANGADVRGNLAVIANGTGGILTVDVTDPTHPNVLATLSYGGDARDVVIQNNFAFVADYSSSFTSIEITDPQHPVLRSSTPLTTGGRLQDVALSGRFAFGADVYFVNGIPMIDIANPTNPVPRAILDFSSFRDDNGTGIAVDDSYVYLTADRTSISGKGTTGDSRLYIGQYLAIQDTAGIPPIVRITSPTNGATVIEGQTITIQADASDDVEVANVNFLVNGVVVGSDAVAPYEVTSVVPVGTNTLTLGAQAQDFGGNSGTASNITLNVIPDPRTTVVGRVVDARTNAVAGATVTVFNSFTNATAADGRFLIPNVPTIRGNIAANASVTVSNVVLSGSSVSVAPVPGGITDVGTIVVIEANFERNYGTFLARCDDCFASVTLPFAFPFFGSNYSRVFFDGNGRVTFNFGDGNYTETIGQLSRQPLIATFWDDLIDSGAAQTGVYYNGSLPDRAVFTWLNLAEYGDGGSTTVQVILFSDGRIQMGYNGVTSRDCIVAVSPGAGSSVLLVDYSTNRSFSSSSGRIVAEQFQVFHPNGTTDPVGSGTTPPGGTENPFDLDHGFVLWTPNASAGFDVRTILPSASPAPAAAPAPSIARVWHEQTLSAIRVDTPNPPVHARNLFSVSAAMYDAWAAYDPAAVGYIYHGKHTAYDVAAARREAISYASYRLLRERYFYSKSASSTLATLDAKLAELGYDPGNNSLDTSTPAGVGNSVYSAVSSWFINDGCYQTNAYQDLPAGQGGYVPLNPPLVTGTPGTTVVDVNRWQPLAIANAVDQNGFPAGPIQKFLGSQWLGVRPYALTRTGPDQPWFNPGPQPRLGGAGDAQFRNEVIDVIRRSSQLTPDDGAMIDISPGAFGNNTLGANDGTGHLLNPATGLPYAPNQVKRGDFARVLAEFWADGPSSETPPGHWNVIANQVADSTNFVKRLGGAGPVLDNLEWDVKVYFALNAAVHDAACAAWSLKRYYDGGRPIEYIRYMGELGQSSDSGSPSYHPNGLPLVPGLVELVTPTSAAAGGQHQGLPVGRVVIYAWPGQPTDPSSQHSGAKWILPENWLPYQKATFVTPSFPGYISGHSTFSRAAAEVLAAATGSPYFPGGLGSYNFPANSFLSFEQGPSLNVQLQWGTYFDAADQAGISRLYGGIHVSADDLAGRRIGSQCGQGVWASARRYYDGSITNAPILLGIHALDRNSTEIRFNTVRGFHYALQSTPSLGSPFVTELPGLVQAVDSTMVRTSSVAGPAKFYRIISTPGP